MPPSADLTRRQLIRAGERLFARHGIDGVSLREITRESGARNTVALQHHFGDRDGLLQAIIDTHAPAVEAHRHHLLDAAEPLRRGGPRRLAAALVEPLAGCLDGRPGGAEYLQIYADLWNRPRPVHLTPSITDAKDSIERWRETVEVLLPPGAARLHRRYSTILYATTELSRAARAGDRADVTVIAEATIDVVAAALVAPVSATTARAIEEHDARR
jgi:AcrR family transcriptional regulator